VEAACCFFGGLLRLAARQREHPPVCSKENRPRLCLLKCISARLETCSYHRELWVQVTAPTQKYLATSLLVNSLFPYFIMQLVVGTLAVFFCSALPMFAFPFLSWTCWQDAQRHHAELAPSKMPSPSLTLPQPLAPQLWLLSASLCHRLGQ